MTYDYLVFIGRFQPFHNGHKRVVERALELSNKLVLLVGSNNIARNGRNPWTFAERAEMVRSVFPDEVAEGRIIMRPLDDFTYNDVVWLEQAQQTVRTIIDDMPGNSKNVTLHGLRDITIGLIGCSKDRSSYYLKLFPTWGVEQVAYLDPINATDIRHAYFSDGAINGSHVPSAIQQYLSAWSKGPSYTVLHDELEFVRKYKQQWKDTPYPPTFVTVDAVVVQSGHLLVVRRGAQPGKGQLALPGGFIRHDELIDDAVFRELREETGIKVPEPVLRGSLVNHRVFDDPNRSIRGRTITHAYLIKLEDRTSLPKVRGGDDAASAFWLPLADVTACAREFFEDHFFIVQNMVNEL